MAYKQVKKYGFRDSLEKGDPEKVIYGVDFDAEFEAIEQAFDVLTGGDETIDPTDPAFADVVFQNRTEAQKVVSEFSFEKAGDSPLTMKNTGMYAGTAYIRYTGVTWEVDPSLNVTGDITAGGDLTVDGTTQLNGDLAVDGNIDATGNISMDGNLAVGGHVDGDLTVNGNIIIDGGDLIDPDGNPSGGLWTLENDGSISRNSRVLVESNITGYYTEFKNGQGIEQNAPSGTDNSSAYKIVLNGSPTLQISNDGDYSAPDADITVSNVNADSFVKSGGTASQLLCADGSVVDKSSVGGSGPDLSSYYTKTESDARFKPIGYTAPVDSVNGQTGVVTLTAADVGASTYDGLDAVKTSTNQTIGGIKTFTSDIRAKANVYAYYGSDERLKDDITPMPVGLIDAIDASTWKWKEDGRSSGGVIAQQLQEIGLDDWVREAPNGDLGVDYNALIGMLIAEVQDLKKKLSDG